MQQRNPTPFKLEYGAPFKDGRRPVAYYDRFEEAQAAYNRLREHASGATLYGRDGLVKMRRAPSN